MNKCTCGQKYGGGKHSDWCDLDKQQTASAGEGHHLPLSQQIYGVSIDDWVKVVKHHQDLNLTYSIHFLDGPNKGKIQVQHSKPEPMIGCRLRMKHSADLLSTAFAGDISGPAMLRLAYELRMRIQDNKGDWHYCYVLCLSSIKLMEEHKEEIA